MKSKYAVIDTKNRRIFLKDRLELNPLYLDGDEVLENYEIFSDKVVGNSIKYIFDWGCKLSDELLDPINFEVVPRWKYFGKLVQRRKLIWVVLKERRRFTATGKYSVIEEVKK